MPEYFSPLPQELASTAPWTNGGNANLGLVFDKCGDAWSWATKNDRVLEFNPPSDGNHSAFNWLAKFEDQANKVNSERAKHLKSACDRQRTMIRRLGGQVFYVRNESRFVTGMGRQHPLENGFSWHHTLGMPYVAGSGLKGMFRAWLRECGLDDEEQRMVELFGGLGVVGELVFFDLLPIEPVQLVTEIMTPHYGDYYRKPQPGQPREPPGDWQSPNPISFLAVEAGQHWQFGITLRSMIDRDGKPKLPQQHRRDRLDELLGKPIVGEDNLLDGLGWVGVGAKTNVGMGRFNSAPDIAKRVEVEEEAVRQQREAATEQARQVANFQASLADASPELQELMKQEKAEGWKRDAGNQKMTHGLLEFAKANPSPPQDCLDWIREFLESIPGYAGVWDKPNAMRGKRADQPIYGNRKGSKIRDIVNLLNPEAKS